MLKYSWYSTIIEQTNIINISTKVEKFNLKIKNFIRKIEKPSLIKAILQMWYLNKELINIKIIKTNQTCIITNKILTIINIIESNIKMLLKWLKENIIVKNWVKSSW